MNLKQILLACAMTAALGTSQAAHVAYTAAGTYSWIVPTAVNSVTVLVVGGGGGGANGHQGGGGAGRVMAGTFAVNASDLVNIVVGAGGNGAFTDVDGNDIIGLTAGGMSAFGSFLSAAGGGVVSGINQGGHNGSSGGGAACNSGNVGGSGGSGGSAGQACQSGWSMPIGNGQGSYAALLALFAEEVLAAGAGGAGGSGSHAGGGGAGGVTIGGIGPVAEAGIASFSGRGGVGYGAGGGAGGFDYQVANARFAGGDGANGVVYLQFNQAPTSVPEPGALALVLAALLAAGLSTRARRR